MVYKDKEKRKAYDRKWYSKHKENCKKRSSKNRKRIQKWFIEYKKKLKCELCGENHPGCIDFHHKREKIKAISKMVSESYSIKKIKEEIKKCTIICANCHRKEHYN